LATKPSDQISTVFTVKAVRPHTNIGRHITFARYSLNSRFILATL